MVTCYLGALGAIVVAATGVALSQSPAVVSVLLVLGGALPMWVLEFRRHSGLSRCSEVDPQHASRRDALLGMGAMTVLFAGLGWTQLTFGGEKGAAVSVVSGLLLGIAVVVLVLVVIRPEWSGSNVLKLGAVIRRGLARQPAAGDDLVIRSWLVRAFFLPLMMGWAYLWVVGAMAGLQLAASWMSFFTVAMALLYAVDTSFGVTGYLLASERLGSHVRSVDATWSGWMSALCCYPPLSVLVFGQWLVYRDGVQWEDWIPVDSVMSWLWGGAILVLTGIYVWATVVFGPRFSNLTHRGIVTAGPYRWLRHPAYLSKNLSWWLISVPFVSTISTTVAVLHCLALLGVNGIYWARAVTEERHLRRDPEYVAYAQWIDRNGLWARIRRLLRWRR